MKIKNSTRKYRKFLEDKEQTLNWVLKQNKKLSRELILSLPNHEEILLSKMKKENQRREKMFSERSSNGQKRFAIENPEKAFIRNSKGGSSEGAAAGRSKARKNQIKKSKDGYLKLFKILPNIFHVSEIQEKCIQLGIGKTNMVVATFCSIEEYCVKVKTGIYKKPGYNHSNVEVENIIKLNPTKSTIKRLANAEKIKAVLSGEFTAKEACIAAISIGLTRAFAASILQDSRICIQTYKGTKGSNLDVSKYTWV
jgi:hypothetical protein